MKAARELTQLQRALLVFDAARTFGSGLSGWIRAHGPQPDMAVLGRPVTCGLPRSVDGFTAELAEYDECLAQLMA